MKRLTTDAPKTNLESALNLFYAKDGEAWVLRGGFEPACADVTLFDYIRSAILNTLGPKTPILDLDDEEIGGVLSEGWLLDGNKTVEGLIATLYTAAWAFAELRARLKMYEDREAQQTSLKNEVSEILCGYQLEDLARVATLIKKCDVKPEEIKRLSDNIAVLYGTVMKGIKKEIKVAADNVLIECRYPGYADVLRMIEEDKK